MNKPLRSVPAAPVLASLAALAGAACLLVSRTRRGTSEEADRSGDVVLITGGSRGLGLALARRFGKSGARLVLAARNPEELDNARQTLLHEGCVESADNILLVPTDLTNLAEVQNLIDQTYARFGRLDILVNNAGIIEVGPIENQPLEAFDRAMNTNFYAALHTIQAALPRLLAQAKRNGRRASIVNISSIGGKIPVPHLLPYVASKFALTGFSEGLHAELRLKGIRVTTVCPGLMRTGSSIQAEFTGQAEKEFRWFNAGAKTPIVAASTEHAANRIFNATRAGCAEITITPQAALAARIHGLSPSTTQFVAALANQYILPAATPTPKPLTRGANLRKQSTPTPLEQAHNQA